MFTLVPRAAQALARGDWRLALGLAGESAARRYSVQGSAVRLWLPDAWEALIAIVVARLDEAFALIEAGMKAAQRDGISANIRVWSMLRCRALFCSGRLADARAEAEATIEMADEIGDGSYGYINHVALYILARVALHTGDAAGLAQARRSAARLGQARESPSGQRLGAWLTALLADADGAGAGALDSQTPVQVLDPLADGPLSTTSPRMYADTAALTRLLLDAGRRADAKSVVARLEDFAAQHRDFPFLESAALHARAVLDGDPDIALRAVALSLGDPRPLVRAAVLEDAGRLLPGRAARRRRYRCWRRRLSPTPRLAPSETLPACAACCAPAVSARRQAGPVRLPTGRNSPSRSSRWSASWPGARPTVRSPSASTCPRTR